MSDIIPPYDLASTVPMPVYTLYEREAFLYYRGIPSRPRLVARTGNTQWKDITGLESYEETKELRPVGSHPIAEVWQGNLPYDIIDCLDTMKVDWTSIDVVRIGPIKESSLPVVLWIGVTPKSLTPQHGFLVACECKNQLHKYNIADVDVEIRESIVTTLAGPRLLAPSPSDDPTVALREPLTHTLGHPIAAESTPWSEGTGGFFVVEKGKPNEPLLVTARHVVFPPGERDNKFFRHKNNGQIRHNITLFGADGWTKYLERIQKKIDESKHMANEQDQLIAAIEGQDDPDSNAEWEEAQANLERENRKTRALENFQQEVSNGWATPAARSLGHVVLSPPIHLSASSYTEDWAAIKMDSLKINGHNFDGNVIDLGTEISSYDLTCAMYPNPQNRTTFKYPRNRLLRLHGTIPDQEMNRPIDLDQNGQPCLMVMKRGSTTGLTIGRANNIDSIKRIVYGGQEVKSREWPILSLNNKDLSLGSLRNPFSDGGDSGAVVVDGRGRIGGILTSGCGLTNTTDISYATPVSFLLEKMKEHGFHLPDAKLGPTP